MTIEATSASRALMGSRPLAESLFRAAERMEHAVALAASDRDWFREAHAVIRAATLAVEQRLDDFAGPEGYAEDIATEEPRLLPELERLEAELATLLVEAWSARPAAMTPSPALVRCLSNLAADMRRVASDEFALVHESLNPPGSLD